MTNEWIKFDDSFPTEEFGKQIELIFMHPSWATFRRGLYTHVPEWTLCERLYDYDQQADKFYAWEEAGGINKIPSHYIILPERLPFSV